MSHDRSDDELYITDHYVVVPFSPKILRDICLIDYSQTNSSKNDRSYKSSISMLLQYHSYLLLRSVKL